MLGLLGAGGATLALGAACEVFTPPPSESTIPTPTPPQPTAAPLSRLAMLRIAIDVDPDTLDPAGQVQGSSQSVVDTVVETLVRLLPDGRIAPWLAERWTQSADGLIYTFDLRQGVQFHDGEPFTALAAKRSLERFMDVRLKVPLRAPFDASLVERVDAPDARTLKIVLRSPSPLLLPKLASPELGILSQAYVSQFPDSYGEEPIGTGPFRFRERHRGESLQFDRFEGYWGNRPGFPALLVRSVPEAATRESLLLAGQVDVLVQPPPADLPTLQKTPNVNVQLVPTSRTVAVAMDLTYPGGTPLSIRKARQALNYAVDRDAIIRGVLAGVATPMDAPMAPTLAGYTRTGPYTYDPARAKQLLLEAGVPGLRLRFLHPTGRSTQDAQAADVAQAIAGSLDDVGVETDLVGADYASYLAAINVPEDKGTAHMHLFAWAPSLLEASQQLVQFSKAYWPPRGLATSHYTSPRVEETLDQAAHALDPARRNDLYAEVQRLVWDDAPWIFLWVPSYPVVSSSRVRGITALPTERFNVALAEPT